MRKSHGSISGRSQRCKKCLAYFSLILKVSQAKEEVVKNHTTEQNIMSYWNIRKSYYKSKLFSIFLRLWMKALNSALAFSVCVCIASMYIGTMWQTVVPCYLHYHKTIEQGHLSRPHLCIRMSTFFALTKIKYLLEQFIKKSALKKSLKKKLLQLRKCSFELGVFCSATFEINLWLSIMDKTRDGEDIFYLWHPIITNPISKVLTHHLMSS